jgi:hypothetical protein
MRKKVRPFPAPPPHVDAPIACHHWRVNVRVGTQNFAIDITACPTVSSATFPPSAIRRGSWLMTAAASARHANFRKLGIYWVSVKVAPYSS